MIPSGWNVESAKTRRAAYVLEDDAPIDCCLMRVHRLVRPYRESGDARVVTAVCWRGPDDAIRLVVFDPNDDAEGRSADVFEVEGPNGRETWSFGGAADLALGGEAA